jgi:hypothetical protein
MDSQKIIKPRNKNAVSPLLKKGHVHRTSKDYNRQKQKQALKQEISRDLKQEKIQPD